MRVSLVSLNRMLIRLQNIFFLLQYKFFFFCYNNINGSSTPTTNFIQIHEIFYFNCYNKHYVKFNITSACDARLISFLFPPNLNSTLNFVWKIANLNGIKLENSKKSTKISKIERESVIRFLLYWFARNYRFGNRFVFFKSAFFLSSN